MTRSKSLFQADDFLLPTLFIDIILSSSALSQLCFSLLYYWILRMGTQACTLHVHMCVHTHHCTCTHKNIEVKWKDKETEEGGVKGRGEMNLINMDSTCEGKCHSQTHFYK